MHAIFRVRSVRVVRPYVLDLTFDDDSERRIDLEGVLYGDLYGPLRDPALFGQVVLDPEVETISWPNGADFDPAVLHDWPEHESELVAQASHWRRRTRSA